MSKKIALIVPLTVLAVLTLSAFSFRAINLNRDISIPPDSLGGSADKLAKSSAAVSSVSGVQSAIAPVLVPSFAPTGPGEVSQQYEYGPAVRATGFAGIQQQYEYGPAVRATGFAALVVYQQYQYGPRSLATGFAALP